MEKSRGCAPAASSGTMNGSGCIKWHIRLERSLATPDDRKQRHEPGLMWTRTMNEVLVSLVPE
jgi:hypothetical protein